MQKPISLTGIVLAAGHGTRMRSRLPKVLHELLGKPLLEFPLALLRRLGCDPVVAVIGSGGERVRQAFAAAAAPPTWAVQDPPAGTGDAVRVALEALAPGPGDVLIVNGDLPLLTEGAIRPLVERHREEEADFTLLSLHRSDPRGYGRIVRDGSGAIARIVEEADADDEERRIQEVNGGVYVARQSALRSALAELCAAPPTNAQGEVYLPPVVEQVRRRGGRIATWTLPPEREEELEQVNDRRDLARVITLRRAQNIRRLQEQGVTVLDPDSTYVEEDVEVGRDTVLYPFTVIARGVRVGEACEIGPFAQLGPGTVLEDEVIVGNFTETKRTHMEKGSKAKHLSYLGDGQVGKGANIGAGTIFANFDGRVKSATRIGEGAFVGSGTVFVAPVELGPGARTGAGAVVLKGNDVPAGETVVGLPARPLRRDDSEEKRPKR